MIKFLLNQKMCQVSDLSPNTTVLNFLRQEEAKKGTKEGCASGDCGACTVVLGDVVDGRIRYTSVNACITFISALHGKQLITVEDLKSKDGALHQVQQALVDFNGTQCGYCTPGFVMSMFALSKNTPSADKHAIFEALAGNLCRCTGYRSIIDSAIALAEQEHIVDAFECLESETVAKLSTIERNGTQELTGNGQSSYSPDNVAELAALLVKHPDASIVAGGTDLALEVTQFHRPINTLISVGNVAEMKDISVTDTHIEIGAARSLTDSYSTLALYFPDFGELLHRFASLQVRNQGTLGGNIGNASPIGDTPPALIALNAQVELRCGDDVRLIDLEDYFIGYKITAQKAAEFITKIVIPLPTSEQVFGIYKLSKRIDDDISAVLAAFNITLKNNVITDVRLAFGGMAATPMRAQHAEKVLLGAVWEYDSIYTAMQALDEDFSPLSDFRASKEYRSLAAKNLLKKFYLEQQSTTIETRVTSYV
ncbi:MULTISPECIES: xanthine dehydrogenase small subunit [unclassified Moritella]|uniref:xanthine dehydrogenase small subunit n=1 Tax=unclassified Moritella TaxID=2637987 RepID=UPI001BEF8FCE|nr:MULTISPECIES: xanthine dehydrogenase small subunit [unclassified Moritella]QUM85936.1 xanthine dehydrogenase small subunit [Moritella sp. 28]QUM90167.1 xanthine dehydrogenase small subunit [Moritella sp. 36]